MFCKKGNEEYSLQIVVIDIKYFLQEKQSSYIGLVSQVPRDSNKLLNTVLEKLYYL